MVDVSIVIVSMNNMSNLGPCLDSIKLYTSVSYEVFVVAYLFSADNLDSLKKLYPWVHIIISNEIRGFSENNNLALQQVHGKYCFVLNDDTFIKSFVIDDLVRDISELPKQVAIISPNIKFPNGKNQFCGRRKFTWLTWILDMLLIGRVVYLWDKKKKHSGIFKSYNISGSAFLIKTNVFCSLGWFNEDYFFCPEDIALSDLVNKKGMFCFVDSDVVVYHIGGGSTSKIRMATLPAYYKGSLLFYSQNNRLLKFILASIVRFITILYTFFHLFGFFVGNRSASILVKGNFNVSKTIFSDKTPKELFVYFYSKINNN